MVLVEKGRIGGVCLHWGGLATKTLTSTVELYKSVEKRSKKGIHGTISLDWKEMKESKDGICSRFSKFCEIALTRSGVRIVQGTGEILTPTKVKIVSTNGEEEVVETKNILIAVGSLPSTIPGVELEGPILDSDKALELETPPESLLIICGGVIDRSQYTNHCK